MSSKSSHALGSMWIVCGSSFKLKIIQKKIHCTVYTIIHFAGWFFMVVIDKHLTILRKYLLLTTKYLWWVSSSTHSHMVVSPCNSPCYQTIKHTQKCDKELMIYIAMLCPGKIRGVINERYPSVPGTAVVLKQFILWRNHNSENTLPKMHI